jgi:hypothetical protein
MTLLHIKLKANVHLATAAIYNEAIKIPSLWKVHPPPADNNQTDQTLNHLPEQVITAQQTLMYTWTIKQMRQIYWYVVKVQCMNIIKFPLHN